MNDLLAQSIRNIQRSGASEKDMADVLVMFYDDEAIDRICDLVKEQRIANATDNIKDKILTYSSRSYCRKILNKNGAEYSSAFIGYAKYKYNYLIKCGMFLKYSRYPEFYYDLHEILNRDFPSRKIKGTSDYYISFEVKRQRRYPYDEKAEVILYYKKEKVENE